MALTTIPKGMRVRDNAWHRLLEVKSPDRPLRPADVIRQIDGSFHFVQYVNTSGAYIVPLSSITREIKGQPVNFTSGGRTISSGSLVEVVNPLQMGGNSSEYRRYVKMVRSLEGGISMEGIADLIASVEGKPGTQFDSFDDTPYTDPGSDLDEIDGHTILTDDDIAARLGADSMAKKAKQAKGKSASKGGSKRVAAPKTVRNCVCGCGVETTGYFAPGHDARYHGWVKKLADGRIQRNGKDAKSGEQVVTASVLNKMSLVAKGEGFKATTPEFYKN